MFESTVIQKHSLKGVWHEIFDFWFFSSIPLGPFCIFSKIRGDIREYKLFSGVNDTGEKVIAGVNDTCE